MKFLGLLILSLGAVTAQPQCVWDGTCPRESLALAIADLITDLPLHDDITDVAPGNKVYEAVPMYWSYPGSGFEVYNGDLKGHYRPRDETLVLHNANTVAIAPSYSKYVWVYIENDDADPYGGYGAGHLISGSDDNGVGYHEMVLTETGLLLTHGTFDGPYYVDPVVQFGQSEFVIPQQQWVQIGITYDDTQELFNFYLNGSFQEQKAALRPTVWDGSQANRIEIGDYAVSMGGSYRPLRNTGIMYARMYNGILSDDEMLSLFESDLADFYPPPPEPPVIDISTGEELPTETIATSVEEVEVTAEPNADATSSTASAVETPMEATGTDASTAEATAESTAESSLEAEAQDSTGEAATESSSADSVVVDSSTTELAGESTGADSASSTASEVETLESSAETPIEATGVDSSTAQATAESSGEDSTASEATAEPTATDSSSADSVVVDSITSESSADAPIEATGSTASTAESTAEPSVEDSTASESTGSEQEVSTGVDSTATESTSSDSVVVDSSTTELAGESTAESSGEDSTASQAAAESTAEQTANAESSTGAEQEASTLETVADSTASETSASFEAPDSTAESTAEPTANAASSTAAESFEVVFTEGEVFDEFTGQPEANMFRAIMQDLDLSKMDECIHKQILQPIKSGRWKNIPPVFEQSCELALQSPTWELKAFILLLAAHCDKPVGDCIFQKEHPVVQELMLFRFELFFDAFLKGLRVVDDKLVAFEPNTDRCHRSYGFIMWELRSYALQL